MLSKLFLMPFSITVRMQERFYYFITILMFKGRDREKKNQLRLGTVSCNIVDVTVGALKGIWLCRRPGARQRTWDFGETLDMNSDKATFDCTLLVVL